MAPMSYLPFPKAEAYGVEIGYEELILAIKAHSLPQESRAVGGCASERRGRQRVPTAAHLLKFPAGFSPRYPMHCNM